jgi:hypothetical protein
MAQYNEQIEKGREGFKFVKTIDKFFGMPKNEYFFKVG